jgi:copper resistance protein B
MARIESTFVLLLLPVPGLAQGGIELMDEHVFTEIRADEFEFVDAGDENDFAWDLDLSVGGDLHKFWSKTRGRRGDDGDETELQFLYSKAILPFWNLQAGVRRDLDPGPNRNWAVVGLQGLAPYFFEVEAEFFLAEGGQTSFRVRGEYELLLTQRLILSPELEIAGYGREEPLRRLGSGLSEVGFDLRLRYEIKREIAPYVGLGWHKLLGGTKQFAQAAGQDADDLVFSIGIRAWY